MKLANQQRVRSIASVSMIALISLTLSGCGKIASSSSATTVDPFSRIEGEWLSSCINFGAGLVTKVYMRAEESSSGTYDLYQAFLLYSSSGCAGAYTIENQPQGGGTTYPDAASVPIASTTVMQDVSDVPSNFGVFRTTQASNSQVTTAIMHIDDAGTSLDNMFATSPATWATVHPTWAEWLNDANVAGFADDPAGFVPTGVYNLHFTKGGLP